MGKPRVNEGKGRIKGGAGDTAKQRAAEELLRRARDLKPQLVALDHSARSYHRLLEPEVSSAEIELLATTEADLLGTLECLFNSDIQPVVERLGEVEDFLAVRNRKEAP